MIEMASCGFDAFEGCVIFVSGKAVIRDDDWDVYCAFAGKHWNSSTEPRSIVFSDGPALTSIQRKKVALAVGAATPIMRSVVITSSPIVRGVVTAISWLGPSIRSCSPEQRHKAFAYLDMPEARTSEVRARLDKMIAHYNSEQLKTAR
jgi:hypothetical protein